MAKVEAGEKRMKDLLTEKEKELDEEKMEYKRRLNTERKKAVQSNEGNNKLKEEFDKKKATLLEEIIYKDEHITHLSKQLDESKKEVAYLKGNNYIYIYIYRILLQEGWKQ